MFVKYLLGVLLCVVGLQSNAALLGRDLDGISATAEAYYDTALNITWLADANYVQTSGYDSDGRMTWAQSVDWASQLVIAGFDGWRLPSTVDDSQSNPCLSADGTCDGGSNITRTSAELSHLFLVTLGNQSIYDENNKLRDCFPDCLSHSEAGPFENVFGYYGGYTWDECQTMSCIQVFFWSEDLTPPLVFSSDPDAVIPWSYVLISGSVAPINGEINEFSAWAVHDGDIGSPVAVPAAIWLFGPALGLLGWFKRRPQL